mmetsp:Transcript_98988/g.159615  ORF Transcript_98988/g.159615 Transcript_98988/m.159615 type:complete len:458 (+) Transcript_98988:1-1374(+)
MASSFIAASSPPQRIAIAAAVVAAGWAAWHLLTREETQTSRRRILVAEPSLTSLEEKYLIRAYRSTFISGGAGSYKDRLEKEFAAMCGCKYGVAVCNGTVAIDLVLVASGLKKGDEVIVPSFTYIASVAAIVNAGGVPVLVDSDPRTGLIDPRAVAKAISPRTKFLMVVHLYGYACDMDPLLALASEHSLTVIEDAAESHGATYKGKVVGSFGAAATFSFYANKTMTTGEGGIVVTNDANIWKRLTYLRGHAMSPALRFWHTDVGYNYRLSNLLCAVGVAQLERFPELVAKRKKLIDRYIKAFDGFEGIKISPNDKDTKLSVNSAPAPWLACVELPAQHADKRDFLCSEIESRGIETRPFFYPVHTMPPYRQYRMVLADGTVLTDQRDPYSFQTVAERFAAAGFNIPTTVDLPEADVTFILKNIKEVLEMYLRDGVPCKIVRPVFPESFMEQTAATL